jgi:hypothetical protein
MDCTIAASTWAHQELMGPRNNKSNKKEAKKEPKKDTRKSPTRKAPAQHRSKGLSREDVLALSRAQCTMVETSPGSRRALRERTHSDYSITRYY